MLLAPPKADVFCALLALPKAGDACALVPLPKILFVDPNTGGEETPNMLVDAVVVTVFVELTNDGLVLFGWPNVEENPPPKPLFVLLLFVLLKDGDPKILDVAVVVVIALLFNGFSVLPKAKAGFDNELAVTFDPAVPKRLVIGAVVVLRFDDIPNVFDCVVTLALTLFPNWNRLPVN